MMLAVTDGLAEIRRAIAMGQALPGERLPPARDLAAAALIALRAANTRGEPASEISGVAAPEAVPNAAPDAVGSRPRERRAEL